MVIPASVMTSCFTGQNISVHISNPFYTHKLTSRHDLDMDRIRERTISYRSEGQDLDSVSLRGSEVLNGGDDTVLDIMNLPLVYRPGWIHGIVHTIAFHLITREGNRQMLETESGKDSCICVSD